MSTSGQNFNLSRDWAQKPGILYFYPKNFTPKCTKEACSFRDKFSSFKALNITVLGISQDSVESHQKFKKAHDLPFDLLSDKGGRVSKLYKATIPFFGLTKRITYLLDQDHRVVAVYENMFGAKQHIRSMIAALER